MGSEQGIRAGAPETTMVCSPAGRLREVMPTLHLSANSQPALSGPHSDPWPLTKRSSVRAMKSLHLEAPRGSCAPQHSQTLREGGPYARSTGPLSAPRLPGTQAATSTRHLKRKEADFPASLAPTPLPPMKMPREGPLPGGLRLPQTQIRSVERAFQAPSDGAALPGIWRMVVPQKRNVPPPPPTPSVTLFGKSRRDL